MIPEESPPRLVDSEGPVGDCLRSALQADAPPPRFALLQARRQRRVQSKRVALMFGFSAFALLLLVSRFRAEAPTASIGAENYTRIDAEPTSSAPATDRPDPTPAPNSRNLPSEREAASLPARRAASSKIHAAPPEPLRANVTPESTVQPASSAARSAKSCGDLLRAGPPGDAIACYAEVAKGTGMTAELALFEQARLEGKVLRQPERALATLEDYRSRFPTGSLRAEVVLAQIDWLTATGQGARALALIDEALASGLAHERAAELLTLRESLKRSPTGK